MGQRAGDGRGTDSEIKIWKRSGIFSPFIVLKVTTKEPQFSQNLSIAVLEELDKLQREFKSKKVIETINYIEQKIDIAKNELEKLFNY